MKLTGHQIMHAVCHHTGFHRDAIRGVSRIRKLVAARKLIIDRMIAQGYTTSQIARRIKKDPSTVLYHLRPAMRVKKLAKLREYRARA